jgi:hypothetical protein
MVYRDGSALVTPAIENNMPESSGGPPRPFQVESYTHLLRFPLVPASPGHSAGGGAGEATRPAVDAIVVPTIRSAEKLRSAVQLAVDARCQLIPLYTESFPDELSSVLDDRRLGTTTPLALPYGMKHELLGLAANLPQEVRSSSALDISRKRNLGLLIGRMCGWTRMLLLDDDIRKINSGKLSAAATLLDRYPVVGLQVNKYPDASVVGHARRLTGHRQQPFVSGGSLLVNPQSMRGYFPAVYHEDWLCIMNHLRLGEVAIGGTVGQLPYKPFTTPQRARFEEFGDILAAGLLWLIRTRKENNAKSVTQYEDSFQDFWHAARRSEFWAMILSQRATVLDEILSRLELLCKLDTSPLQSLSAAQARCEELSPDDFVSFTEKWLDSQPAWQTSLSGLPRVDSVMKALTELGLSDVVSAYEADDPKARAAGTGKIRRAGSRRMVSGPGELRTPEARRWSALARTRASVAPRHVLEGVVLNPSRRLRSGIGRRWLLRGHDRGSRLGGIKQGGRASGRAQRPPARGNQAEHEDHASARSQQQPGGVTGGHESGLQRAAVQVRGQDRAGDGHAERLADLTAGGGNG